MISCKAPPKIVYETLCALNEVPIHHYPWVMLWLILLCLDEYSKCIGEKNDINNELWSRHFSDTVQNLEKPGIFFDDVKVSLKKKVKTN